MLKIGLTGGIGSGKSTVSQYFSHLGIPVIDADNISRELVFPGSPAMQQITSRFGHSLILPSGELDRAALRERIFANKAERKALEAILHPLVREKMNQRIATLTAPYCILSIPLLIESGWQNEVDRILVVDTPVEMQIARTCQRDKVDRSAAEAAVRNQVNRETRLAAADDVITNDVDIEKLNSQIDRLHTQYLALAAQNTT